MPRPAGRGIRSLGKTLAGKYLILAEKLIKRGGNGADLFGKRVLMR